MPGFELRLLRERYIAADPAFTPRHLIDTQIVMIDHHSVVVSANARLLRQPQRSALEGDPSCRRRRRFWRGLEAI